MEPNLLRSERNEAPIARPGPGRRFRLGSLLLGVLSYALALAALRSFYVQAFTARGAAAALILASIGFVVGRIFAEVPTARQIAVVVSAAMFIGVVRGDVGGEQFVLWSFACLTFGLLLGLLSAGIQPEKDS